MAGYYRFQAYFIRVFLVIWWVGVIGILINEVASGESLSSGWWLMPMLAIPMTVVFWFASRVLLKMAEKR